MSREVVYLLETIEDYGKFMNYITQQGISNKHCVFDTHIKNCYQIQSNSNKCFHSSYEFFESFSDNYKIVKPIFKFDRFNECILKEGDVVNERP